MGFFFDRIAIFLNFQYTADKLLSLAPFIFAV